MRRLLPQTTGIRPTAGWISCIGLLIAPAPAVLADVSIEGEGRQSRTGPKQIQREYNGVQLDPAPSNVAERPSGRMVDEGGRGLRSEPTQRVSVGIIAVSYTHLTLPTRSWV